MDSDADLSKCPVRGMLDPFLLPFALIELGGDFAHTTTSHSIRQRTGHSHIRRKRDVVVLPKRKPPETLTVGGGFCTAWLIALTLGLIVKLQWATRVSPFLFWYSQCTRTLTLVRFSEQDCFP